MEHRKNLLDKAIEMRARGERYMSIVAHLRHNCKDEEEVRSIITEMDELEKSGDLERKKPAKFSLLNTIGGVSLMAFGCALCYYFWGKGFVVIVPFLIILLGAFMCMQKGGSAKFH